MTNASRFSTEQCEFLEKGDEELIHWMKSVREELGQASRILMNGNLRDIHNTRLYGEMLRRLPKESIIEWIVNTWSDRFYKGQICLNSAGVR